MGTLKDWHAKLKSTKDLLAEIESRQVAGGAVKKTCIQSRAVALKSIKDGF